MESIFSDTKHPSFQSFSIHDRKSTSTQKYTINIIDTPGLFEVKEKGEEVRNDEVIAGTIAQCLDNEITNIHAIIMFATFEAGIHPEDIKAMKKFLSMFGESGVKIALCITRADGHNKKWRENLVSQLKKHGEFSELIDDEKMDILFMGCVNRSSSKEYTADDLSNTYKTVYNMREVLLRLIFGATKRIQLADMKVTKDKADKIKNILLSLIESFRFFTQTKDFGLQNVKEKIIEHKQNLRSINENKAYLNLPDMFQLVHEMMTEASAFQTRAEVDKIMEEAIIDIIGSLCFNQKK